MYVDTSALGRSLLNEPDRDAIERALETFTSHTSSSLLRVELRRLGLRRGMVDRADALLAGISLIPVDEQVLAAADTIEPAAVATLDAVHLATAVRLAAAGELDALMTYDKQLAQGARAHGISVLSPT